MSSENIYNLSQSQVGENGDRSFYTIGIWHHSNAIGAGASATR